MGILRRSRGWKEAFRIHEEGGRATSPEDLMPATRLIIRRNEDGSITRELTAAIPIAVEQQGFLLEHYVATVPALPKCRGAGLTPWEAISHARRAIMEALAPCVEDEACSPFEEPEAGIPDSQVRLVEVAIRRRVREGE